MESTPRLPSWMEPLYCWFGIHFGYVLEVFNQNEYGKVDLVACARCKKVWVKWPYFSGGGRG